MEFQQEEGRWVGDEDRLQSNARLLGGYVMGQGRGWVGVCCRNNPVWKNAGREAGGFETQGGV